MESHCGSKRTPRSNTSTPSVYSFNGSPFSAKEYWTRCVSKRRSCGRPRKEALESTFSRAISIASEDGLRSFTAPTSPDS